MATAKKPTPKKAVAKKSVATKASPKKAVSGKAVTKKTAVKKAVSKKPVAAKKTKKTGGKKKHIVRRILDFKIKGWVSRKSLIIGGVVAILLVGGFAGYAAWQNLSANAGGCGTLGRSATTQKKIQYNKCIENQKANAAKKAAAARAAQTAAKIAAAKATERKLAEQKAAAAAATASKIAAAKAAEAKAAAAKVAAAAAAAAADAAAVAAANAATGWTSLGSFPTTSGFTSTAYVCKKDVSGKGYAVYGKLDITNGNSSINVVGFVTATTSAGYRPLSQTSSTTIVATTQTILANVVKSYARSDETVGVNFNNVTEGFSLGSMKVSYIINC